MKLSAVILNYNDYQHTAQQLQRLLPYEILDDIVLVDNCSTDDSAARLQALLPESPRTHLIRTRENGGYGAGNNAGIRYAIHCCEATHILVANPDTVFSEELLRALLAAFEARPKLGVASAVMQDGQGGRQQTAWPLRPWLGELLNSGPLSRRIFRGLINYRPAYLQKADAVAVDVVHGSLLMLSAEAFLACGGYDERVFLYGEENILGFRMKQAGYKSVLLQSQSYSHENSGTISKTYSSMVPKQKLRQASERFYYREYLHISRGQQAFTQLFQKIVLLETWAAELLHVLH